MKLALASLVLVTACGGTGDPGAPDAPTAAADAAAPDAGSQPGLNGGTITVFSEIEGFGFLVELYASATPPAAVPTLTYGDGHCDVLAAPALPPEVAVVDRDLGATVTATDGVTTFIAPVTNEINIGVADFLMPAETHPGAIYFYGPGTPTTQTTDPGFGRTWMLSDPAGPLATIAVPEQIDQQETFVGRPDPTVHYSGGAGAQYVHIHLGSDGGTAECYPAAGTTSFTVPADVLDTIVVTKAGAFVNVFAKNRSVVDIDGRQVVVTGVAQSLD